MSVVLPGLVVIEIGPNVVIEGWTKGARVMGADLSEIRAVSFISFTREGLHTV